MVIALNFYKAKSLSTKTFGIDSITNEPSTTASHELTMSRANMISTTSVTMTSSEVKKVNQIIRESFMADRGSGSVHKAAALNTEIVTSGACPFVFKSGAIPVQDNNLLGLTMIPSRSYEISFVVFPEGIVSETDTSLLTFQSSGIEVAISLTKNSTVLK